MEIKSFEHEFKGFGIHPSKCIVEIREGKETSYITFVNTGEGTSVTNAAEQIANEIRPLANNSKVRFFERYIRRKKDQLFSGDKNTYDEITFKESNGQFYSPDWSYLKEEEYFKIVKEEKTEVTKNFKNWNDAYKGMTIDFFAMQLKTSNKTDLSKCFDFGNPLITFSFTGDKPGLIRIEEKGSDTLRVLLRQYF